MSYGDGRAFTLFAAIVIILMAVEECTTRRDTDEYYLECLAHAPNPDVCSK